MNIISSLYDPILSEEGTIDPLGLGQISEHLAGILVPGVRERMKHPRYLTAISAGAHICYPFIDMIANDGISEPFLVYEWHIIQALYKVYHKDSDQLLGMAGKLKAQEAFRKGDSLSMNRYLKNAYTFGFHGIYRTLSEDMDIAHDNILGEQGDRLLRAWEEEQGLSGFITHHNGKGKEFLSKLRKAVSMGLEKGEVAYPWSWKMFDEIAPVFAPYKAGPKERNLLFDFLLADSEGYRGILLQSIPKYLESNEEGNISEDSFHKFLMERSERDLKDLLHVIQIYEQFCRLLFNAFYKILQYLTDRNRKVSLKEILEQVPRLSDLSYFLALYEEVSNGLSKYSERLLFEDSFGAFAVISQKDEFLPVLINHHQRVQAGKPPSGKMPWLEQFTDGHFMIRPAYRQAQYELPLDTYVNFYRLSSLIPFYNDLNP